MSKQLEYRKKREYRTRYIDHKWIAIEEGEREQLERNAKNKFEYRETTKVQPTPSLKKAIKEEGKKKVKKEDIQNNED